MLKKAKKEETKTEALSEIDFILLERQKKYGSFFDKALLIQNLKYSMRGYPRSPIEYKWMTLRADIKEALDMIQHKIGRIITGDPLYKDSWNDIIGYAKLIADTLVDEKKEEKK